MDLEPIKARLAAATPGKWEWDCDRIIVDTDPTTVVMDAWIATNSDGIEHATITITAMDLAIILNAPTDIAALVREVEQLRDVLASFPAALERLCKDENRGFDMDWPEYDAWFVSKSEEAAKGVK